MSHGTPLGGTPGRCRLRDRQIHDVKLASWMLLGAVLALLLGAPAWRSLLARAAARRELATGSDWRGTRPADPPDAHGEPGAGGSGRAGRVRHE